MWLLGIMLAGCGYFGGDDGDGGKADAGAWPDVRACMPPAELTYLCDPLPLGAPDSCAGGPALYDQPRPDLDKAFPVGCEAQLPFCVGAYPNSVQTCYCQTWTGTPEWSCPV